MKNKYNFLQRLFLLIPSMCIAFILWVIIALVSDRSLGKVLKETGENLLKD